MVQIELHHSVVSGRLDEAGQALGQLSLSALSGLGKNQLVFTGEWQNEEQRIHRLLSAYREGVRKTIADTRANVDLLKRQDEVIP
ncbi:DUF5344 family protein [Sporolactobacillus putidus]|uniref:Uncharacterized protein n=1 Tax=Sporolactobacillus putidus TaxID=492735 RepID=A0A917RZ27_9BACL|nr:DUF5344 family protein [Sporolactobacillus putidus]GGL43278.1 hypothetical protein GCM10007968_03980 [Sporolactobacillus putidus]